MILTKEQRAALKRVFDREPIYAQFTKNRVSYRQFRRTVQPYFGGECIMVPWKGMWLGIETDGHTHS